MIIRDVQMDIDVRAELEPYFDRFRRRTDKGTHMNSCSPFRDDNHPSFYVYFNDTESARAGYWGDHAADDAEFSRGTFLKLLAFLRNESEDETFAYLNGEYGTDAPADVSRLSLRKNIRIAVERFTRRPAERLASYEESHTTDISDAIRYMRGRGIHPETVAQYKIGQSGSAVAIPWFNGRGELVTVKYRSMESKKFWYMTDGGDITNELFGVQSLYTADIDRLYIVESEIDALYLHSLGYYAIALGNKAMNRGRAELLRKLRYKELCIIPDNDEPGMFAAQTVVNFMAPYTDIFIAEIPEGDKDINDLAPDAVHSVLAAAEQIKPLESKIEFHV